MGKNQDPGSGINIPDPQHWLDKFSISTVSEAQVKFFVKKGPETLFCDAGEHHRCGGHQQSVPLPGEIRFQFREYRYSSSLLSCFRCSGSGST
jgi:hypothetical protein